jgi:transketolase
MKAIQNAKATRDAFGDILPQLGEIYDDIVALDADLGSATKIKSFGDKFPERFFQIGIAEANMIGIASGLSEYGYKVFLASFGSFLTGRYDIIRCSLAYSNSPVVLVGTHVGMAIGKDGVTQMGLEDVSLMRALPNMKILNPATYSEAVKVVKYLCETKLDGPHYLRLGRQPVKDLDMPFEFGKGQIVKEGNAVTLFSTGCILGDVLEAVELIKTKCKQHFVGNFDPQLLETIRVVNLPTLKPIDKELIIKCAKETKYLFSIEDHSIIGGLGSVISEVLTDEYPKKLTRIGLNDIFPESGPPEALYEKYGLSAKKIADRVLSELDK